MNVDVVLYAGLLDSYSFTGKTVVVIDAFRATSVIVEALQNGAKEIIPVSTIEEAYELKQSNASFLLGGERGGMLIQGFDFDNSPFSYTAQRVAGREICLTTTNGTRALNGVRDAEKIYIGSFLNLPAVALKLVESNDVVIVCAGSEDTVSLEDSLCAGGILAAMELHASLTITDAATILKSLYLAHKADLQALAEAGTHYQFLKSSGFEADLRFCLTVGKRSIVPVYDGLRIVKS